MNGKTKSSVIQFRRTQTMKGSKRRSVLREKGQPVAFAVNGGPRKKRPWLLALRSNKSDE